MQLPTPRRFSALPSVMQTLYECKVGITLYWDGVTIEIPVGKAQPKQALRVYWTKTKLMDLYNA